MIHWIHRCMAFVCKYPHSEEIQKNRIEKLRIWTILRSYAWYDKSDQKILSKLRKVHYFYFDRVLFYLIHIFPAGEKTLHTKLKSLNPQNLVEVTSKSSPLSPYVFIHWTCTVFCAVFSWRKHCISRKKSLSFCSIMFRESKCLVILVAHILLTIH